MGLDETFDDGEPEPGAALFARAGFVDTIEPVEEMRQRLFRNADPVISDLNDSGNWAANESPSPGTADVEWSDSDSDSDGMSDSWGMTCFKSISAENGGADDDWDEDGSSNYDEYIAGTDPTHIDSVFAFQTVETGEDCVLTWSSATGKVYSLWGCTNLVSGEFSIINSPISSPPPLNTFTAGVDNAECMFFQLRIEGE